MRFSALLLTLFLFSIFALEAASQSMRTLNSTARRIDDFNRQADKAGRDEMLREMNSPKPSKEDLRKAAQINAETKEDLETLQTSYNEIAKKLGTPAALSDIFVKDVSAKIRKHSLRLRTNIVFSKDEGEKKIPRAPNEVRARLKELCLELYKFLTNPIFENLAVMDIEASAKARLSLDFIIESSDALEKKLN